MASTLSKSTIDIRAARAGASFTPSVMNALLRADEDESETRARISRVLADDPVFEKSNKPYMSRQQRLEKGLQMSRRLIELQDEQDWSFDEYTIAMTSCDEALPLVLHEIAFVPVIAAQASNEQQEVWLPQAMSHAIIGCYLQTELGHGKLETTATFDTTTDEFVINSPTVTSTKWWIGGLGLMSTHGVVQARLFINGKDYGPHLFITQLRSLKNHAPMPGVLCGEIGPKVHAGFSSLDNGWASFDNVRIPRDQMLQRFSKVSRDGTYSKPSHDKLSYGSMTFIRAQMISNLAFSLAKATTISTRYLHIRRQFADPELKPGHLMFGVEHQVISYPSVYMRLLPQIAKAYVFITAGKDMTILYDQMSEQLKDGDTTLLAETHAVSSGLKSYVSSNTVEGIETVRRAMGGHGFLDASGVGRIYAAELPSTTYEGDNFILNLQVVRAAVKTLANLRRNPSAALSPSSAYLSSLTSSTGSIKVSDVSSWLSRPLQIQVISLCAARRVERVERLLASGKPFAKLSWECVATSKAIVEAFLVTRTIAALEDGGLLAKGAGPAERKVLDTLIHFYALTTIEDALSALIEFGVIAPVPASASAADILGGPIELLRQQIELLAHILLPDAIGLTDAFNFSDWDLGSAVGKFDGKAYESLLEKAKKDLDVNVGDAAHRQKLYENEIKPILARGRKILSNL